MWNMSQGRPWYSPDGATGGADGGSADAANEAAQETNPSTAEKADAAPGQEEVAESDQARREEWKQLQQQYQDLQEEEVQDILQKRLDALKEEQQLQEREKQTQAEQKAARQVMGWREQETALKKQFPDFDLNQEMEASGGELFRLLQTGVPLERAYRVLHLEELLTGTLEGAMQRTQQRTLEQIATRGGRPGENGTGAMAERAGRFDVTKLSRARMEALEKRCAMGEKVTPDMMIE